MNRALEVDLYFPIVKAPSQSDFGRSVLSELTEKFGGVTQCTFDSQGFWKPTTRDSPQMDQIAIVRVLAPRGKETVRYFEKLKMRLQKQLNEEDVIVTIRKVIRL